MNKNALPTANETQEQFVAKAAAAAGIFRNSTGQEVATDDAFANQNGLLDLVGVANALPYLLALESVLSEDPTYQSMVEDDWRAALIEGVRVISSLPIMGSHQLPFEPDGRFTPDGYAACVLGWRMANAVSQRDWGRAVKTITPWPAPLVAMQGAVDDYLEQVVTYGRVPTNEEYTYIGWAPTTPEQVQVVFNSDQYLLAALEQCPPPGLCILAHPELGGFLEMLYALEVSAPERKKLMASLWPAVRDGCAFAMTLPAAPALQ